MTAHALPRRLARLVAVVVPSLLAALVPSAHGATGRDITAGYEWRDLADGAVLDTVAFTAAVQRVSPVDNSTPSGPFNIGIPGGFRYYGVFYTQLWVSDNGWISFVNPGVNSEPTPRVLPDPPTPTTMLAPYWNDLQIAEAGGRISVGPNATNDIEKITINGLDVASGGGVNFEVLLFADGRIKFQYRANMPLDRATVGIDNAPGNDGFSIASGGTVVPGVALTPNYVIEILPPPVLTPTCATIPAITCGSTAGSSPAPGVNVNYYGCSTFPYAAQEKVYSLTLAAPATVNLTLTAGTPLTLFLLSDCNERHCIRGPGTSIGAALGSGTYYICVDGPTGSEGAFTLDVACLPIGEPLSCDTTVSGTTVGGSNFWSTISCQPALNLSGPEHVYLIDSPIATNVLASITTGGPDLDLYLLSIAPGEITGNNCILWGDAVLPGWGLAAGQYLLVVDGIAGASGTYDLTTTCGVQMDCSTLAGTIDLRANRAQVISGDTTTGATDAISVYSCYDAVAQDGPEQVYEITLPEQAFVMVSVLSDSPGIGAFLTDSCNEGTCVGGAVGHACSVLLAPGVHYLVVDSAAADAGPYDIEIGYETPFDRWDTCQDPDGATQLTDTVSDNWHFTDGAYCYTDPASHNYPDGCTFAMYVVVSCGTEMHLPLFDVEGGHVRVFDLFAGAYVELTASSTGGFFMQGDDIRWADPNCATGDDPRWNNIITDVMFKKPDGICGVYRIEFVNHSGFVWELYANCSGAQTPLFMIYDTACGALNAYDPLPNVSIANVSAVASCPDIEVTYTLRNDGCKPATNFEVRLTDNGTTVYTDVVPEVPAQSSVTQTFTATFPTLPTGTVRLTADPSNTSAECNEVQGAVACNVVGGTDVLPVIGCSNNCQVTAAGTVTPMTSCIGGTVDVDASASSSSLCPGGMLEYQLSGPSGLIAPWQSSPNFTGIAAFAGDLTIEARCADPALQATCLAATTRRLSIEQPPTFGPAPVTTTDQSSCAVGIMVRWPVATFHGATGTGTYSIYRADTDVDLSGTIDCADALASAPIVTGLTTNNYGDVGTTGGSTYFYVVEAEDSDTAIACTPVGPHNAGTITRVACNDGVCTGITDVAVAQPALLPRIGATLRAGGGTGGIPNYGQTFVDFTWSTTRPLDTAAGEHFHVVRSEQPDRGFVSITPDTPPIQVPAFTDFAADDTVGNVGVHVWHYYAWTVDACENDDSGFDDLP